MQDLSDGGGGNLQTAAISVRRELFFFIYRVSPLRLLIFVPRFQFCSACQGIDPGAFILKKIWLIFTVQGGAGLRAFSLFCVVLKLPLFSTQTP